MEKQKEPKGNNNIVAFRDTRGELPKWEAAALRGGFDNLPEFLRFAANYAVKKKVRNPLNL